MQSGFPSGSVRRSASDPEIIPEALPQLRALVIDLVGPSTRWPMVVRDRVMGFLLARDRPAVDLEAFAGQAAVALELASGYTDALHAVRRSKDTQPAAEIQQNLLPPRLARVDRADVAGGALPGYDVGGDFFDYAGNADGLWLVVADATGKGNSAAALSSLAIGALRAAAAPALACSKPRGWPTRRSWRSTYSCT